MLPNSSSAITWKVCPFSKRCPVDQAKTTKVHKMTSKVTKQKKSYWNRESAWSALCGKPLKIQKLNSCDVPNSLTWLENQSEKRRCSQTFDLASCEMDRPQVHPSGHLPHQMLQDVTNKLGIACLILWLTFPQDTDCL